MQSKLTALQRRVLDVLARAGGAWTLSGGGALAGFHLGHRHTDDLDLFFHGVRLFDREPRQVEDALVDAGLRVATLQRETGFVQLDVRDDRDRVVVDLVAEPVPTVAEPVEVSPGLRVDAPHEILVNKLNALVSRSELRDLEDVRALLAIGGDLERALTDATIKDGGFSPMTLAWLVRSLPLERAPDLGFDVQALAAFRDDLLARLAAGAG